jgi:hypothetical protein
VTVNIVKQMNHFTRGGEGGGGGGRVVVVVVVDPI